MDSLLWRTLPDSDEEEQQCVFVGPATDQQPVEHSRIDQTFSVHSEESVCDSGDIKRESTGGDNDFLEQVRRRLERSHATAVAADLGISEGRRRPGNGDAGAQCLSSTDEERGAMSAVGGEMGVSGTNTAAKHVNRECSVFECVGDDKGRISAGREESAEYTGLESVDGDCCDKSEVGESSAIVAEDQTNQVEHTDVDVDLLVEAGLDDEAKQNLQRVSQVDDVLDTFYGNGVQQLESSLESVHILPDEEANAEVSRHQENTVGAVELSTKEDILDRIEEVEEYSGNVEDATERLSVSTGHIVRSCDSSYGTQGQCKVDPADDEELETTAELLEQLRLLEHEEEQLYEMLEAKQLPLSSHCAPPAPPLSPPPAVEPLISLPARVTVPAVTSEKHKPASLSTLPQKDDFRKPCSVQTASARTPARRTPRAISVSTKTVSSNSGTVTTPQRSRIPAPKADYTHVQSPVARYIHQVPQPCLIQLARAHSSSALSKTVRSTPLSSLQSQSPHFSQRKCVNSTTSSSGGENVPPVCRLPRVQCHAPAAAVVENKDWSAAVSSLRSEKPLVKGARSPTISVIRHLGRRQVPRDKVDWQGCLTLPQLTIAPLRRSVSQSSPPPSPSSSACAGVAAGQQADSESSLVDVSVLQVRPGQRVPSRR